MTGEELYEMVAEEKRIRNLDTYLMRWPELSPAQKDSWDAAAGRVIWGLGKRQKP